MQTSKRAALRKVWAAVRTFRTTQHMFHVFFGANGSLWPNTFWLVAPSGRPGARVDPARFIDPGQRAALADGPQLREDGAAQVAQHLPWRTFEAVSATAETTFPTAHPR